MPIILRIESEEEIRQFLGEFLRELGPLPRVVLDRFIERFAVPSDEAAAPEPEPPESEPPEHVYQWGERVAIRANGAWQVALVISKPDRSGWYWVADHGGERHYRHPNSLHPLAW